MKKRFLSLIIALAMMVGLFTPLIASAEGESTAKDAKTETVTLHKILMDKKTFTNFNKGTKSKDGDVEYDGNEITNVKDFFAGKNASKDAIAEEANGVYFAWAKKDTDGKYYWIKSDGNFTGTKTEVKENELDKLPDDTFGGKTENDKGIKFTTSSFKGEYKIYEIHDKSTYIGKDGKTLTDMKAVPVEITLPLVNEKGTVINAHVYPKNTEDVPDTHKDFTKEFTKEQPNGRTDDAKANADAEPHNVGDVVDYTVTTKVPAKTKWKTAFWDDKMTEGLTYITKEAATGDLAGKGISIKYDGKEMDASWYTLDETSKNGFTLKLTDKGLEEIAKATEDKTIRLDYHATLNEKAVVAIPESNDVTFHYGNNKDHGNTPVPNKPNENGELTITKTWDTEVSAQDVEFTLYNAQTGKIVAANEVASVDGYKFENPVTIKAGDTMSYTWKGLNKNIEYKVVETHIDGHSVEYGKTAEAGGLTAKNYKDNNPKPINPNEPKVVTYGAKFVKTDTEGKRLPGAQFVIRNAENKFLTGTDADRTAYEEAQKAYEAAIKAYNALEADKQTKEERAKIAKLEKARDDAWNATLKDMTKWGEEKDAIKLTSNELGQFEIAGLKDGKYTLVEITPPEGYANNKNEFPFEIKKDGTQTVMNIDFGVKDDDLADNALQVINKKVTIPQTGGIGTIIFTAIGLAIMASAIIAIKKRQATEAR
ncbi:pilin N-terminal domain-containing protein [Finegoldia magna]|uniref:pilin N-terminal domain-containing protein n=1 Tax=Finegoldia magna TaxID=1260 RepID=UPI002806182A|nr:pilin N-terminal domain-containing protein [Finegoldia magna]MDU1399619.1 pilin N-terminal domain-containing protein [Finegoldia magna]